VLSDYFRDACVLGKVLSKSVNFFICLFHCFTNDPKQRERWLQLLEISEDQLTPHSRVCSRHFPGGDSSKDPQLNLGKQFSSALKKKLPRAKSTKARERSKELSTTSSASNDVPPITASADTPPVLPLFTSTTGEQFCVDHNVHELPNESGDGLSDAQSTSALPPDISSLIKSTSSLEMVHQMQRYW